MKIRCRSSTPNARIACSRSGLNRCAVHVAARRGAAAAQVGGSSSCCAQPPTHSRQVCQPPCLLPARMSPHGTPLPDKPCCPCRRCAAGRSAAVLVGIHRWCGGSRSPCSLRLAEAGQLRGCRARHGCRAASGQSAYRSERGRQRAARGSALCLRSGRSALAHALLRPSVALLGREGWLRSLWRPLSGSRRCCGRLAAQEGPTAGPGGGEGSIGAHGAPRSAVPCSLPAR